MHGVKSRKVKDFYGCGVAEVVLRERKFFSGYDVFVVLSSKKPLENERTGFSLEIKLGKIARVGGFLSSLLDYSPMYKGVHGINVAFDERGLKIDYLEGYFDSFVDMGSDKKKIFIPRDEF